MTISSFLLEINKQQTPINCNSFVTISYLIVEKYISNIIKLK